ncbi:MAG: hypothetical protein M3O31_10315 [Acidobacteriota bacterium]|nr:hypothetical protein [Acidobacteriota bacterium]
MMTPTAAPGRTFNRRLLLIPLAALISVMPLMHYGCSCGHDFDFHFLSWMEAAQQFSHGNLHPHWAFTPAFNAGEPRFVFYPPLSWYVGALLGLLLTHLPGLKEATAWSATPILFTWIALTLSGLTLYRLARTYANPNAALLAAILYLANPYMLFTAYERTAYAELLATAWIPLLFHAVLRDRITIPAIALPVALLWLTNAPAAVMGCYSLALLALVRIVSSTRTGPTLAVTSEASARRHVAIQDSVKIFGGTAIGIALAAFYIIPAAYERRYVQIAMATISGMRVDQNFLFEHTGSSLDALLHDQVLNTASWIAVILLTTTAIALAANVLLHRTKSAASTFPATSLAVLTIGIAFLLTPPSLPIWNHAPQSTFLQFPWRLLAILATVLAIATAAALSRLTFNFIATVLASILFAIVVSHAAYRLFRQPCDPEDTAPARLALFHSNAGTDPTDEYTPNAADNDALAGNEPPDWLAASPTDPPPEASIRGSAPMHLTVTAPRAEYLVLNLRDYPAWLLSLNNKPDPIRPPRPDGLIAVAVPAGNSTIDIRYAYTPDQVIGDAVTLLGLALFGFTSAQRNGVAVDLNPR